MAEQRLDVAQVGAAAEQMRRAGVAQRVWREADPEASPVGLDPRAQARGAEARAVAREKERGVAAGRERRSSAHRDFGPFTTYTKMPSA